MAVIPASTGRDRSPNTMGNNIIIKKKKKQGQIFQVEGSDKDDEGLLSCPQKKHTPGHPPTTSPLRPHTHLILSTHRAELDKKKTGKGRTYTIENTPKTTFVCS